jgi:hypothetical protein
VRYGKRLVAVAAATGCVAAGALGGVASSGAATTAAKSSTSAPARMAGGPHGAVHSESVVLNRAGTAYETVVSDEGTLTAVSGSTLTIKEGTSSVTYKTVTVTVPSGATVMRNGQTAQLSDLKSGDNVRVSVAADGASVMAGDASFRPADGHHGHGPDGAGAPGDGNAPGPPPATTTTTG